MQFLMVRIKLYVISDYQINGVETYIITYCLYLFREVIVEYTTIIRLYYSWSRIV